MAKQVDDSVRNAALSNISSNANRMVLLQDAPTSYSDATTLIGSGGKMIGEVAVSGSDFSQAAGDTSGRKVTVAGKNVTVTASGSDLLSAGNGHVAVVDDDNNVVLAQSIGSLGSGETADNGKTVQVGAWDVEVRAAA